MSYWHWWTCWIYFIFCCCAKKTYLCICGRFFNYFVVVKLLCHPNFEITMCCCVPRELYIVWLTNTKRPTHISEPFTVEYNRFMLVVIIIAININNNKICIRCVKAPREYKHWREWCNNFDRYGGYVRFLKSIQIVRTCRLYKHRLQT